MEKMEGFNGCSVCFAANGTPPPCVAEALAALLVTAVAKTHLILEVQDLHALLLSYELRNEGDNTQNSFEPSDVDGDGNSKDGGTKENPKTDEADATPDKEEGKENGDAENEEQDDDNDDDDEYNGDDSDDNAEDGEDNDDDDDDDTEEEGDEDEEEEDEEDEELPPPKKRKK